MNRRLLLALSAVTVLIAGCSDGAPRPSSLGASSVSSSAPAVGIIRIKGFVFAPKSVRLPRGTVVEWVNEDDAVHSVVAADRTSFDSGLLNKGDDFSFTPNTTGTTSYICGVHQYMTGTLIVE